MFLSEGLGGNVAQVGIISAISSMASVPANIIWGNLSDTLKQRKVFVLIGFIGLAIPLLLMGLATDITTYYLANFILGGISAAAAPVGTVLVLESFDKKEWGKRLGDFSRVGGIGWLLGLTIGTIWLNFMVGDGAITAMRMLFIGASLLALLSVVLAWKWVKEPKAKIERKDLANVIKVPFISFERGRYTPTRVLHVIKISAKNLNPRNFPRNLKIYFVVMFLAFTGFLTFYVGLPIFLSQQLHLSLSEVFIVYVASSTVSAITYSQAGKWSSRIGSKRLQQISFAGRIILFPSMFLVTLLDLDLISLILVLCVMHGLIGFCWANLSVAGNVLVSNMSYCDFRTESLGMYCSIQGIASVAGSLLGGFLANYFGYLDTFLVASGFVIIAFVLLTLLNVDRVPCDEDGPKAEHV
ncbi:MAG: MFS transporter [Methanomassiliicoccales archaeon]|nr:MFS transporter [Methanomassiliicoccales archaeon]